MESNVCPEDSINSIKFQANQEKVDLGIGRLYECIFCKRGFNTAQALGGHMNIHRKDRARHRENSSKQQVIFSGPRSYEKIAPPPSTDDQSSSNNNHCNSANTHLLSCDHHLCSTCCSACFLGSNSRANHSSSGMNSGELRKSLSLESPPVTMDELKRTRGVASEEELDLELRLGYDS